jgi:branched-chain amino acid transport system substrate-binding protein
MRARFASAGCWCVGLTLACFLVPPAPVHAADPPIRLGEFLDITGGGATAAETTKFALDIAVADINAAGGISGRQIVVITADTQTDPTVGVGEITRLVQQEKVDVIIGPLISQVALASLPVATEAKIPEIGTTGSDSITTKVGPYYFSLLINAASQAKAMVDQAERVLKAKSGAIISDSGAQSKSFVESMKQEMAARGMTLTGVQEYQYRATDMTPQLLTLKRGNPDTLFLFTSSGEDAGNVLKGRDELGWNPKVTGNYTVATYAGQAIKVAGADALHDTTGLNYLSFTYCDPKQLPKAFLDFVARARTFNAAAAARLSLPFAATVYDGVFLLKDAIEANGGKTDGPTIAAWIEANGSKHTGILGALSASPTSHFLVGADALAAVYPDRMLTGGLQQRFGCQ